MIRHQFAPWVAFDAPISDVRSESNFAGERSDALRSPSRTQVIGFLYGAPHRDSHREVERAGEDGQEGALGSSTHWVCGGQEGLGRRIRRPSPHTAKYRARRSLPASNSHARPRDSSTLRRHGLLSLTPADRRDILRPTRLD